MSSEKGKTWRLSGRDLDFQVDTVSPGVGDKPALKQIIHMDKDFKNTLSVI